MEIPSSLATTVKNNNPLLGCQCLAFLCIFIGTVIAGQPLRIEFPATTPDREFLDRGSAMPFTIYPPRRPVQGNRILISRLSKTRHSRAGGNPNPRIPWQLTTHEKPAGCRNENTLSLHRVHKTPRRPVLRGLDSRLRGNDGLQSLLNLECACPALRAQSRHFPLRVRLAYPQSVFSYLVN